jgi:hypothetical protein
VQRLVDAGHPLPPDVQRVLDERLHFSPVAAATDEARARKALGINPDDEACSRSPDEQSASLHDELSRVFNGR